MSVKTNKKRNVPRTLAVFASPRALCLAGLLAAISLILGKFLQIPSPISQVVRISFENLPIILAGLVLGPLAGAMTGAVADLVGCALYGYAINPIITLGACAVGLVAGLVGILTRRAPLVPRVALTVLAAHAVGSVLIKTAGLAQWYLASMQMGYAELTLYRAINYLLVGTLEAVLLCLLLRHRGVQKQLERMCR